jgi:OOP family OmpA-OmpF porin
VTILALAGHKGRPATPALGSLLMLSAAVMLLGGCVGGAALRGKATSISESLDAVHKQAYKCEPRALAIARANLEFTLIELDEGAYFRAADHMEIAEVAAKKAQSAGTRPECQENLDRDGDGIFDQNDKCPDVPEDIDGYEDEDGCPEDQDTDGDGIPDSLDKCPREPEDFDGVDDQDGCPDLTRDRDGDGIPDELDQCPDQPEDKDGFEDQNGCPDPDNDQDGILDVADRCPLQPEDRDGFEDEDGCPDPDNDQDRIADAIDQCPNQPEDYDGDADEDGCPDLYKTIVVKDDRIELKQKVFFATASDRILERSFELLNEVALALRDFPTISVRIEGHTDSNGSDSYNLKLSQRRAASVRRYLMAQGIDGDRMISEGYGEERPIEDNRTSEGRAANRRVEFHIIKR